MTLLRFSTLVLVFALAGCGESNPAEKNAAANDAADAYCKCAQEAVKLPPEQLKDARCEAEEKAYKAAWEALPVRARDPKAAKIDDYYNECANVFHDAVNAARNGAAN